jgi:4-hydroxyacetophenone monooxygenase
MAEEISVEVSGTVWTQEEISMHEGPARSVRHELLEATDETVEDAVEYADPMVLRGLLYQLTGDDDIATTALTITTAGGFRQVVSIGDDADIAFLRQRAVTFLKEYRDSGAGEIGFGPAARVHQSVRLAIGLEIPDEDLTFWEVQLGLDPWALALQWSRLPDPERLRDFSVGIIGAGMGGLNAAVYLQRAGIPYTLIEKNPGVGGTWFENRYPGCRVDTPSRSYTHVFGSEYTYPYSYCPWPENKKYLEWVADSFSLYERMWLNTEARALEWDEDSGTWAVSVRGPEGDRVLRFNAVITSVGFLNRPKLPDIEGVEEFGGDSWHSARWPEGADLSDKRVAVVGTGASGYQLIPELARHVEHLTVFQRTAQWLFPVPGYLSPLPDQVTWLDRNLPYYPNFARLRSYFTRGSSAATAKLVEIAPDFEDPHAISPENKMVRDACIGFLGEKLGDPELVAKMTPPHPVLAARPVVVDVDDNVLDAILRDNVSLITAGIRRINTTAIETVDGVQHEVDTIVYCTGFCATDYLFPMSITGRNGMDLNELWAKGGPRAYRGCSIPNFPNLFTVYGPNTNGGLLPSSIHEMSAHYALRCIEQLVVHDNKAIEVKEDAYWQYNDLVDRRNLTKVWSDPRNHGYYWSEYGRSVTQCPFTAVEMFRFLHEPNFEDYEIR